MADQFPTKLRTAIIGCGKVAATHAAAWRNLPASEFVAVCDRNPHRAEALAAQFGVRPYSDLGKMLNSESVDVLSICTHHTERVPLIETAARAGVHVIAEKPITTTIEDCDRCLAMAEKAGIQVGVVSQRRYYPAVQRMKDILVSGRIGRPILVEVTMLGWRSEEYYRSDHWRGTWRGEGGGVLVSQAPHYLDLMCWLAGPALEVYGSWDTFNHSIEVDDTAAAFLRFENGALGTLALSNSQKPGLYGRIHIHTSSGASIGAETDSGSPFISGVSTHAPPPFNDLWTVPGEEHLLEIWKEQDTQSGLDVMTHYHQLQLSDFLSAVRENRPPILDGLAGRRVVELFTAIYRCRVQKAPVTLPLPHAHSFSS